MNSFDHKSDLKKLQRLRNIFRKALNDLKYYDIEDFWIENSFKISDQELNKIVKN